MNNSQEIANLIKKLAKTKKIAIGQMLRDCDLSVNTLSSMQSGGYYPRLEAISKIADYLDCSVDYLLGRDEQEKKSASGEGGGLNPELAALINRIPDDRIPEVVRYLRFQAEKEEKP